MGVYENINGSQIPIASNLRLRNVPIEGLVTEEELVQGLATKNDVFQYETMPTPSVSNLGKVVQYIGETTSSFTNGYFYKCGLVDNNYVWKVISNLPTGGTTGQVLVKKSGEDYDAEWGSIKGIIREKVYTPVEITLEDGFVRFTDGEIRTNTETQHFEIPVVSGERYSISSKHNYYIAQYALYDENGNFVSAYPTTVNTNNIMDAVEVTIPEGVVMMRGSGYGDAPLKVYKVTDGNYTINNKTNDVLYGKKWVVCGDSFTSGALNGYTDSEGHTGYESDGYDPIQGKIKTYSYFIADRTGINVDLLALGGSTFTNISGAYVPFSNESSITNYTQISTDADYITLAYGLNETSLTAEQIGTKTDTTNETLWGAYNVVLTSILTANPSVKIGIIINDAWMSKTYHDALIEIAENWGIPYLDLKDGVEVPVMIDGRLDGKVNATAKTLRNGAFKIAANAHPTPEGHKYRSTVIENFLRSL